MARDNPHKGTVVIPKRSTGADRCAAGNLASRPNEKDPTESGHPPPGG